MGKTQARAASAKNDHASVVDHLDEDLNAALIESKNVLARLLQELGLEADLNVLKRRCHQDRRYLERVLRSEADSSELLCVVVSHSLSLATV